MDQEELLSWASKYNVQAQSQSHFWDYIKEYLNEVDESTSRLLKKMDFKNLTFKKWDVAYSVICMETPDINIWPEFSYKMLLYYYGENIGFFEIYFTEDGQPSDETLKIDESARVKRLVKKHSISNNIS